MCYIFFGDQNALWKVVREQSRFLVRLLLLKDQEISGHLYDEWNGHEPEKVVWEADDDQPKMVWLFQGSAETADLGVPDRRAGQGHGDEDGISSGVGVILQKMYAHYHKQVKLRLTMTSRRKNALWF